MSNSTNSYRHSIQIRNRTVKIFGPPGTGKTTTLIKLVEKYLKLGVEPWQMAYVSFTNKAVDEAVSRVIKKFVNNGKNIYKPQDFKNFRTIHSFCKNQLRGVTVLDAKTDMLDFHTSFGTISAKFTEEDANIKVFNNWCLRIYDKARNMMVDPADVYKAETIKRARYSQFKDIVRNYEEFKKNYKIDFTDMISKFIDEVEPPHFKVFIVDEAQDLTPLQWKFVDKIANNADKIYIAGDDDQAIYEWNGAKVNCFLDFPGRNVILKQSHRLNKDIHEFSKLLLRMVKNRQEKEFTSNPLPGLIRAYKRFNELPIEQMEGSWLILGRIGSIVKELKEYAKDLGLYFQDMKGNKSFSLSKWNAILYWNRLKQGNSLIKEEVGVLYDFIVEIKRGWREIDTKGWNSIHPNEPLTLVFLQQRCGLETTSGEWHEVLNRKFTIKDYEYFNILLNKNINVDQKANIIIDTIHSVKGGEADHVAVYEKSNWPANFNTKNSKDKEEEIRVWYTGITRAKKSLHLLSTTHEYYFPLCKFYSMYMNQQNKINDK